MSIQAVSWVLENSPTKALERLVLISLANHAGEDGECWPSVERIAAEANTTPVQARRVLGALEAAGHIARTINAAPDSRMRGDRRTNLYRILDGGAQNVPPWLQRATAERADGVPRSDTTGARSTRVRATAERAPNHQEPSAEPSVNQNPVLAHEDAFETFWRAYPRKTAKPAARKAWDRAVKRCDPDTIIGEAGHFRDDPNRIDQFTPHPATWLNQDRWNDGPLPSRTGARDPRSQAEIIAAAAAKVAERQAAGLPSLFALPGGGQR